MPSAHSNPTQAAQILAALRAGQSLTPLAARQLYGCDRLSARIFQLRRQGHAIQQHRIVVHGRKSVAEYFMPLKALAAPIQEYAE